MNRLVTQSIMVWLLPVIVIGGFFWPLLGYLVLSMMVFFLALSYSKGRFWCYNLCPRGSFLDLVVRKFSVRRKIPDLVLSPAFKWTVFVVFMAFFILQFVTAEKTLYAIGFVFVKIGLIFTVISIVLGVSIHERAWCAFCPMGTLQAMISSLNKKRK